MRAMLRPNPGPANEEAHDSDFGPRTTQTSASDKRNHSRTLNLSCKEGTDQNLRAHKASKSRLTKSPKHESSKRDLATRNGYRHGTDSSNRLKSHGSEPGD